MTDYPDWFLQRIRTITSKRPRIVAEHILKHGSISTDELTALYGYKHPPRAARDLRELGIPLQTRRVTGTDGRSIAVYTFGDVVQDAAGTLAGRQRFSKAFKAQMVAHYGTQCGVCGGTFEARYLQIDHRVPYQVGGDSPAENRTMDDYQLVCGVCNRSKSWSCEHCENGLSLNDPDICRTCYWAQPQAHTHAAMRPVRRIDLIWQGDDLHLYERLQQNASVEGETLSEHIKRILAAYFDVK
ncbi:MAG: HNH endonuclease [bacterium]|nr:HNH endonuclease [bacterium]